MAPKTIFDPGFLIAIRALVNIHHSIYPELPPQGIYFEALVEEAFRKIRKPFTTIEATGRNQPRHDLLVEGSKISLKTETGEGTHAEQINITKLCTTEREPWTPRVLVGRVLEHLGRYDVILMLRAIWGEGMIHYQLVEIPTRVLKLIKRADLQPVGRRKGRRSLGANVLHEGEVLYHVHFDGSDGKCQIRNLRLRHCKMLDRWDLKIRD